MEFGDFASAKTHRNPRVHIISLLDSFLEKMFPKQRRLLTHSFRSGKYTQVTVKSEKDAAMSDTLALEWFSFSRNVELALLIKQRVSGRDADEFVTSGQIRRALSCLETQVYPSLIPCFFNRFSNFSFIDIADIYLPNRTVKIHPNIIWQNFGFSFYWGKFIFWRKKWNPAFSTRPRVFHTRDPVPRDP